MFKILTTSICAFLLFTPSAIAAGNIFSDDFELGDTSGWSFELPIMARNASSQVVGGAALNGTTFGFELTLDGTNTQAFVRSSTPTSETLFSMRFMVDPNSLTMADGEELVIASARTSTGIAYQVLLGFTSGGGYRIGAVAITDSLTPTATLYIDITDAPNQVMTNWTAASGVGSNNGLLELFASATSQQLATIDNDTLAVDSIDFGAVTGVDGGTSGTFFVDEFESFRILVPVELIDFAID